jgi:non-heme chloroperoxidase
MGCGVIARYLSHFDTGRASRSVWLAPTTPYPLAAPDNPDGIDPTFFMELMMQVRKDRAAYTKGLAHSFLAGPKTEIPVSQAFMDWGIDITMKASPYAAYYMIETFSQSDQRAEIKTIQIPVLLIQGDLDVNAPAKLTTDKTLALLPNGSRKFYPDGAHGFYMVEGPQVRKDLLEFMRK